MPNDSYGACPSCKWTAFGVPAQFMGSAAVKNGQLVVADYTFQGNSTPKFNTDAIVCEKCGAVFSIKDVSTIEACEMCNSMFCQSDMRVVKGTDGLDHKVCANCLAKLTQPSPAAQAPVQQDTQAPTQQEAPVDITKMSPDELIAYATKLREQLNASNEAPNVAPQTAIAEEAGDEPINFIPISEPIFPKEQDTAASQGVQNAALHQAQAGINMPVFQRPIKPAAQLQGASNQLQAQAASANQLQAQSASTNPIAVDTRTNEENNRSAIVSPPVINADKGSGANNVDKDSDSAKAHRDSSASSVHYIAATPNASGAPNLISSFIDPTAFPFQPSGIVDVKPNGGSANGA